MIKHKMAKGVLFGFGICSHGGLGDCTSLEAGTLTDGSETHLYTYEAYANLFRQYYSTVNPQQERDQMNAAKAKHDAAKNKVTSCQNALKKASGKTTKSQTQITVKKPPKSVKAKAKGRKVTVSWKKINNNKNGKKLLKQIKSIQVQYSTDPTFQQNVKTKSIKKNKTKVTFKLRKKTQYYIRVRYAGKNGASNWSGVKRVRTK